MARKSDADYLIERIQSIDDEAFPAVADAIAKKSAQVDNRPKDAIVHIKSLEDELKDVRDNRGKMKGMSTGYTQLDAKMGGLESGSVILVGGETSNGKSAVATNIAVNVASHSPVLYISLEMTLKQMLERLDLIVEDPTSLDITFQKSFALSYKDLEPLLQKAVRQSKIKLVVLDYLQYLGRGMTLDEVAKMSKEVKSLALRYNIAFVVIVSIRKGGADAKFRRKWKDIEIEDLMGTSAIGYDADVAMVVSRKDEENEFRDDKVYVKVLKTRNTRLDFNDRIIELEWDRTKVTEAWKAA